ncbi:MAG: hypothetical protein HKN07_06785 [Acidimicrobiia bacterium]|nr:hypothetical protein [Acidimicrobiia bacterium]
MTWKAEIEGLHDFFADWFSGSAQESDLTRLSDALEADFTIVDPNGAEHTADETVASVDNARGSRATRIETRNHRLLSESADFVVARYEEWHDGTKGRISTVVFRKRDEGLGWLTVQETWL